MVRHRLKAVTIEGQRQRRRGERSNDCLERLPLKFDQAETKLMYTLQWMLLDAPSECADNDPDFKRKWFSLKGNTYEKQ